MQRPSALRVGGLSLRAATSRPGLTGFAELSPSESATTKQTRFCLWSFPASRKIACGLQKKRFLKAESNAPCNGGRRLQAGREILVFR